MISSTFPEGVVGGEVRGQRQRQRQSDKNNQQGDKKSNIRGLSALDADYDIDGHSSHRSLAKAKVKEHHRRYIIVYVCV